jgi:hypothetical protein
MMAGSGAEPTAAVHGVDLKRYAELMTRLASGEPRAQVLDGAALDEQKWLEIEKTWGLRLAEAAQRGNTQALIEFEKGVADAQKNASVTTEPRRSLQDYAHMVALTQSGVDPVTVCARAKLRLGEFFELQQAWTQRLTKDPALAAAFREMVASARNSAS